MNRALGIGLLLAVSVLRPAAAEEAELHTWTSEGGRYSIEASLEGSRYDAKSKTTLLVLKKADGSVIEVPADKLSRDSRSLAARLLEARRTAGDKPDGPAAEEKAPYFLPDRVEVLPVFLVPTGEPLPTADQKAKLMKHLKWSQERFEEMLGGRDTFAIAADEPDVVQAAKPLEFYRGLEGPQKAFHWMGELLDHYGFTRFNCPYVFLLAIMNPADGFPTAGGRPINGGYNTGGGIVVFSSHYLDHCPNFQSTLRHELAHGFGLLHVDAYGYEMSTNPSIMAYNKSHHTNGFEDSETPGVLIPEDVRGLALNRRVFAKLEFDQAKDVPAGYSIRPSVRWLPPMEIPGQVDYDIAVTTDSGEAHASKAQHVVLREIRPDRGPGVTFDAGTMWTSDEAPDGWVWLELTFPLPVRMDKIAVHSEHSGKYHAAHAVRIEAKTGDAYG